MSVINTAIPALNLNFFTLDTAYTDGKPVLVELGHGEYSSLKNLNPDAFAQILGSVTEKF